MGLEETGVYVCERCKYRFLCFTTRNTLEETPLNGLCNTSEFLKLDYETVKQIHIEKAKKQGRYFPQKADQSARVWGEYAEDLVGP